MRVGLVGGTGPAGTALAARLAAGGTEVFLGSRSADRAEAAAADLVARWPQRSLPIMGGTNLAACEHEIVVLATSWSAATDTARELAAALDGRVVISMANALARVDGKFQAITPPGGSVAVGVAEAAPGALVAAAFQHLPAANVADLDRPLAGDVLVCSDHPEATKAASRLVDAMPDLRALDAGGLVNAGPVEAFTAVLVGINSRYRSRASVALLGFGG
ncbi:MAG: NADPH-dependent F420 reductase [Acidimicrobiales bacterium]